MERYRGILIAEYVALVAGWCTPPGGLCTPPGGFHEKHLNECFERSIGLRFAPLGGEGNPRLQDFEQKAIIIQRLIPR